MATITILWLAGPKAGATEQVDVPADLVGFLYEVGALFNAIDGSYQYKVIAI